LQSLKINIDKYNISIDNISFYEYEGILNLWRIMKNNRLNQLSSFLQRVSSDAELKPNHISICAALCQLWIADQFQNPMKVSRRQLMLAARIKSKVTYHRIMRDLGSQGYIKYHPSNHPSGSRVYLLIDQVNGI
jgi:hypothetical protein